MRKRIEIYIKDKYDLVEKYNENRISRDFLNYIIEEARLIENNKGIRLVINKMNKIDGYISTKIKVALEEEYTKSMKEHRKNNKKQIILFLVGILFIFLSSKINQNIIWKEILLISGWVPVWEMLELEMFSDTEGRNRRKAIKKLLIAEMQELN